MASKKFDFSNYDNTPSGNSFFDELNKKSQEKAPASAPDDAFAEFEEAKRRAAEQEAAAEAAIQAARDEATAAALAAEAEAQRQLELIAQAEAEAAAKQREAEEAARQAELVAKEQEAIIERAKAEAEAKALADAKAAEERKKQIAAKVEAEEKAREKAKKEAEEQRIAEEKAKKKAEQEAKQKAAQEAAAKAKAEQEAKQRALEEERLAKIAEKEAKKAAGAINPVQVLITLAICAVACVILYIGSGVLFVDGFFQGSSSSVSDEISSKVSSDLESASVGITYVAAENKLCIANDDSYKVYFLTSGNKLYTKEGKYKSATTPEQKVQEARDVKASSDGADLVFTDVISFVADVSNIADKKVSFGVRMNGDTSVAKTEVTVKVTSSSGH